ncbi:MAG: alanine racemase [bacterium]|nr:alanine racemase [bacterium]MDZ4285811.1 alanine racemase [Candidatus Sungbacteria bacterium]
MISSTLRTWIEIDKKALRHNVGGFFDIISSDTRLMAVIKSNAYGHGLTLVAKQLANFQFSISNFQKIWLGVDSIVEALRLRKDGITNPILVLGFTLPSRMEDAAREDIRISISNFDSLEALSKLAERPAVHLKFDTGMHRQGFLQKDITRLISILKKKNIQPEGVFTHFASAKDEAYPTYTLAQLAEFKENIARLEQAGFSSMVRHTAATGGTLLFPDAHLDMVRIGMGLYGYWPSEEAKSEKRKVKNEKQGMRIRLKPVLSWKTVIAEVKKIPKGSFVGYDLTERTHRTTTIAILPIGYWHGYDRGFSSQGKVLVGGARASVLGRVSMDMVVIDVTDIPSARVGSEAVLIGAQGKEMIDAEEFGRMIGTSSYEVLTRINPLIKRIVV